jgi:hypothetical protein
MGELSLPSRNDYTPLAWRWHARSRRARNSCRIPISGGRHDEIADCVLHGLIVLIQRRGSRFYQSLFGRDFDGRTSSTSISMQLISWSHGPGPAELVEAGAHEATSALELAPD